MAKQLDHLTVSGRTVADGFKSTMSARSPVAPSRNRKIHGSALLAQIRALAVDEEALRARRRELGLPEAVGTTVALDVRPSGAIDPATKLEWRRDRIEVLSMRQRDEASDLVVLHVPDGRLSAFEQRIRAYLNETVTSRDGRTKKPKNAALINVIENFRRAAFAELWTDDPADMPADEAEQWFQLWLRVSIEGAPAAHQTFIARAAELDIQVEPGYVPFPGRIVLAVRATRARLQNALDLLDLVAEVRAVPALAPFFLALKPFEQAEWMRDLVERLKIPEGNAPFVTLLETGVNRPHPLLAALLAEADLHAVDTAWGVADHEGHGTEMAGLALHGDLAPSLASKGPHVVAGRLESVKILPPEGHNPPHLYGWVTQAAAAKVEGAHPERQRTFAMMTTSRGETYGLPSEWSATIDQVACGGLRIADNAQLSAPRLFVLSAGNIPVNKWDADPVQNDNWGIENPGQSWNALTVGACTAFADIDSKKWPNHKPLAKAGLLSPCSMTSVPWSPIWPFKPDVVAEGGNGSNDGSGPVVGPGELRLVTTSHDLTKQLFAEAGDTSAAAAQVSRLCTQLQSRYPSYWPETIRALVVHGARYTPQMQALLPVVHPKEDSQELLRRFGYGRISAQGSLNSTSYQPTMVLQESLRPYVEIKGDVKLGDFHVHSLPWPSEVLAGAPDTRVALRVTLSYFIQPNPSRRGWQSKYRYQSHGLRFAVRGSTEDEERFLQRINKLEREALQKELGEGKKLESMQDPDVADWFLGAKLRSRGSIHSDIWVGQAAQLAEKSHIAVFPVGGWWKDWAAAERPESVRYSLVVTLEALNNQDIDLYTPIEVALKVPIAVPGR